MLSMLCAYDVDGNVIATLDYMVANDDNDRVIGLIDFEAHELAAGEHTAIWIVDGAKGSKCWPEWIGGRAYEFRVELEGPAGAKRLAALVHKTSGYRRERAAIEAAIAAIAPDATGARDIRDIVGGPDRPLILDDQGKTVPRPTNAGTPKGLPIVSARAGR